MATNMIDFMKAGIKLCPHHRDCRIPAVATKTPETCHKATSSEGQNTSCSYGDTCDMLQHLTACKTQHIM